MQALFNTSLIELLLGGGGRLTAIGPVSLRMVLFGACLCATAVACMFPHRRSEGLKFALLIVLMYLLVHVAGLVVGSFNGSDSKHMFTEFQMSLYWLAAPFFALMLQTERDVKKAARLIQFAGIALASAYIATLVALVSGTIPIGLVKSFIGESGEITFRSGEFFIYKGFLYLGVSIVFFVALRGRYWVFPAIFVTAAMILTFTRGFLVSTPVAVLLMLCVQGRWRTAVPAFLLGVAAILVIWVYLPSLDSNTVDRYDASTNQRIEDMSYIATHISAKTLLVGEGFGSLINNRFQIENTFLFILWKLGVCGLIFWTLPLAWSIYFYSKIPDRRRDSLANAFLFGTVLVYVQTMTNPFLNNPIGISFIMLSIFSLRVLSRRPDVLVFDRTHAQPGM